MQPGATVMAGVVEALVKNFTDLKQDLDKIIVDTAVASSPTAMAHTASSPVIQSALPALQLHSRTYSESPGYDDYALTSPAITLPEAIPETITSSSTSIEAAIEAEARAAAGGVDIKRQVAVGTEGSQEASAAAGAVDNPNNLTSSPPTAQGPCSRLSEESVPESAGDAVVSVSTAAAAGAPSQANMQEKPLATSQLSYKDLLEKTLGSYDPRLKQQIQASMHKTSSEHNVAKFHEQDAAAAGPTAASQGHSKFPGSRQQKRSPSGKIRSPASPGSLRIFKQGSGSAQKLLDRHEAEHQAVSAASESSSSSSTGDRPQPSASRRCRSAPREKAAESSHVRRLSPGATAGATAVHSPARSKSNPRGSAGAGGSPTVSPGYIERLYALGVEKQQKRAQAPDKRSVSPVRLNEQDWSRVTTRLFNDARNKEERMRMRKEKEDFARDEAMHITTGGALSDRMHSMRTSTGGGASPGALDPAFYGRQQALLDRKAEWARKKRGSDELSSDDEKHCTFHPEINACSRKMVERRSVEDMQKWDMHRQLHLLQLQEEVSSHQFDELSKECTFTPEIGDLSRQLALQSYAAAPDPRRPWTSSPVHMTAPVIRPLSPPRSSSPSRQLAEAAGASVSQSNFLRHSIDGPHLYANGSLVRNSGLMTTAGPAFSTQGGQANQWLWSAPAAASGLSRSVDASVLLQAQKQQLQAVQLSAGIVMGIPVGAGAVMGIPVDAVSAAVSAQLPEDAVVIQMPNSAAGSRKPLLGPVAPGDGVAFVNLGPIKTSVAPPAAAGDRDVDARQRQVVSPVQAQMGLEQGLGSGDWWSHMATAGAVRGDDSAANTPVKHTAAPAVPSRLVAARAFRDDSAGGSFPVKRASSGGAWFTPVTSTQKASLFAKAKTGAATGGQLQPTLSEATKAALELSQQLGLTESNQGHAAGYAAAVAAATRQQAVPACYVAMDDKDGALRSSNSYSQRYSNSKAGKMVGEGLEQTYGRIIPGDGQPVWRMDSLAASKAAAMQDWQQRQQQSAAPLQTAGSLQKYSAAQLLNARNRSSMGGLVPATSVSAQTAAALAGDAVSQSKPPRPQVSHEAAAAQVLPVCDSVIEASMAESHAADSRQEKAEGFLNHTQSVPFELSVSPRSRLYLSTSSDGGASSPAAQQLLALLAKAEEGGLETAQVLAAAASLQQQHQQDSGVGAKSAAVQVLRSTYNVSGTSQATIVQGLHSPVASSPCLPDSRGSSCLPTPTGSSHNLMTQLQRSVAAAAVGNSKLSACSKAHMNAGTVSGAGESAAIASPSQQQQQQVEPSAAAADANNWGIEAATATTAATTVEHQAADESASRPEGLRLRGSDEGGIKAADMWELLIDEELTPQAKAQRMMKIFGNTMSKRRIHLDSLQQTLEEVSKAVSAVESPTAADATTESATALIKAPAPAQDCATAGSAVVSISGQVETLEGSENMQQLLLRMSVQEGAAAGSGIELVEQQQQQDSQESHAEVMDG